MHIRRAKNGTPSVHPIRGDEIRALRKLRRESPNEAYVFVTERGGPMSTIGFHHLIQRLGKAARMPFSLHPHMLRHACGFAVGTSARSSDEFRSVASEINTVPWAPAPARADRTWYSQRPN
jgi:integrase